MTDHLASFRRLAAILLLALAGPVAALPSANAVAAQSGMLSASAASSGVRGALVAEKDTTTDDRRAGVENGNRLPPWKVAAISAVVPGYGQIYNHAAWKLPIYYGLMFNFARNAIDDNGKYLDYRSQYLADQSPAAAASRDDYRKKRNTQIVWFCIAYLAGIVDAYVDTQLYDFDRIIDEKVGASGAPASPAPLVNVSMKF